jgi:hypothetical protein
LARTGWEAVPRSRHPELMPIGTPEQVITRKGCILMERPQVVTDKVKELDRRAARNQVMFKEQQLREAPVSARDPETGKVYSGADLQLGPRANKHESLVNIRKSVEPIPVPQ